MPTGAAETRLPSFSRSSRRSSGCGCGERPRPIPCRWRRPSRAPPGRGWADPRTPRLGRSRSGFLPHRAGSGPHGTRAGRPCPSSPGTRAGRRAGARRSPDGPRRPGPHGPRASPGGCFSLSILPESHLFQRPADASFLLGERSDTPDAGAAKAGTGMTMASFGHRRVALGPRMEGTLGLSSSDDSREDKAWNHVSPGLNGALARQPGEDRRLAFGLGTVRRHLGGDPYSRTDEAMPGYARRLGPATLAVVRVASGGSPMSVRPPPMARAARCGCGMRCRPRSR